MLVMVVALAHSTSRVLSSNHPSLVDTLRKQATPVLLFCFTAGRPAVVLKAERSRAWLRATLHDDACTFLKLWALETSYS